MNYSLHKQNKEIFLESLVHLNVINRDDSFDLFMKTSKSSEHAITIPPKLTDIYFFLQYLREKATSKQIHKRKMIE